MKLTLFQSEDGDCLLLSGADGKSVLIDGGRADSYAQHAAATLSALGSLDVLYVSHIDDDHISGVLKLLDDEIAWRVYNFHHENGNSAAKKPVVPRPPKVGGIWHNGFHAQVALNEMEIANTLSASARILLGAGTGILRDLGEQHVLLANGVKSAVRVSQRIGDKQLKIPLNEPAQGKLMLIRDDPAPIGIGGMSASIVGPFAEDLERLREEWNDWLETNKKTLASIEKDAQKDKSLLGSDIDILMRPMELRARELGRREKVTAPNLASLMLLVEESGRSILLTGDGHYADVVKGLKHIGKLDGAGMHVSVLKVPHHGSEHNTSPGFCKLITADHYVFCGNGAHQNPDLEVVKCYIDSRLGPPEARSPNAEAGRPFKLWFNSHESVLTLPKWQANRTHMAAVEQLVKERATASGGKLRYRFLTRPMVTISV